MTIRVLLQAFGRTHHIERELTTSEDGPTITLLGESVPVMQLEGRLYMTKEDNITAETIDLVSIAEFYQQSGQTDRLNAYLAEHQVTLP